MGARGSDESVAAAVAEAIAASHPGVEVWDVQVVPAQSLLRVFIDRDGGVDLDCCEAVSHTLAPFRERYGLEVSSPGLERSLVRPAHFARFVGRRVHVRTREAIDGRRTFDGLLLAADDGAIRIALDDAGEATIAHGAITRANLVWTPVMAR